MAAILVDNRTDNVTRFVLEQTLKQIPDSWIVVWYHGCAWKHQKEFLLHCSKQLQERLEFRALPYNRIDVSRYNQLCLTLSFWEEQKHEHLIIFQRDGCPLWHSPHIIEEFISYDYVGAPWLDPTNRTLCRQVGNGGFSFRHRSAMIRCLKERPVTSEDIEDVYFGHRCKDLIRVAPYTVGERFSVESETFYPLPFGFHKYDKTLSRTLCSEIDMLKVFY